MTDGELETPVMHELVDQLRAGDSAAENELLRRIERRMVWLCRKMLNKYVIVRQMEDTGDVLQHALLRLVVSLRELRPASTREFFGLAAEHIRRELLDLTKYYRAQRRLPDGGPPAPLAAAAADSAAELDPSCHDIAPDELEQWQLLHEIIAELPALDREVVGLIFYHGWTQVEAAELLKIDERTVRRKWVKACLTIKERLGQDMPDL